MLRFGGLLHDGCESTLQGTCFVYLNVLLCIGPLWLLTDCRIEPSHVWLLSKLGISLLGIQVCALLPTCVSGQSLTAHPREPDLLVSLTTVCEEPGWE